mmetsp:Transcript_26672/g.39658  ORF Transcript_26672/g.39658 Transcript_26672/m.39658 type:complete len:312 (+) Transcript_26672:501-1436(+)
MEYLKQDPNIESVEVDFEVYALSNMHDYAPAGKEKRHLEEETPSGIEMVNPTGLQQGDNNVTVCVVHTGYDNDHIDLPDLNAIYYGYSPYDGETWNHDGNGHGTHCAGIIGAIGGNGKGVTSLNPDPNKLDFFTSKGLRDSGHGTLSGVLSAVQKCVDSGAKTISMSLGGGGLSNITNDQFSGHYGNDGVLIMAAAGNEGTSDYNYPASYASVMSVAAVNNHGVSTNFSQYNDQVEIAGPGILVNSTWPGNKYALMSGTSAATPHVAGVAALVWSHFPQCSNKQIREALLQSAQDLGPVGCDEKNGYGQLS